MKLYRLLSLAALPALAPGEAWAASGAETDVSGRAALFVLQLAVILVAAKLGAEVMERVFRQPGVLGELLAGVAVGPYALGAVPLPGLGPLFAPPPGEPLIPVAPELYAIGQLAAIVLLFVAGLETDLALFLRYVGPATVVALGGVIAPFALGAWATVLFGFASTIGDPAALFMGAVMTATSVGITARVLADLDQLDIPEGVTVLAAAVVDDVLAIMALALVLSRIPRGEASVVELAVLGIKAFGIWVALTAIFMLGASRLERFIGAFRTRGAAVPLALAVGLLAAAVAERFGLAMIIGAYAAGLGLSARPIGRQLRESLQPVYQFLVPIFFVLMGMLVSLGAMGRAVAFGVTISVLAIIGKLVGCGLPALAVGFNRLGAARIGAGMLPRGEVALIVASVGLAEGAIGRTVFGVAVMMTLVTTLMAPPLLVPLFRSPASGLRRTPAG